MTKKGPKVGAKQVLISIRHKEQQRIKFRQSALPKKKRVDKLEVQGVAGMLNIAKQSTDYVTFPIIDKVYLFSDLYDTLSFPPIFI